MHKINKVMNNQKEIKKMESRIFDGSAVGTKVEEQTAKQKKILEKIKSDAIAITTNGEVSEVSKVSELK